MSNYAKYADLTKLTTEYARRMTRLMVRILSEQPRNLRREIYAYYPRHIETGILMKNLRSYGLYRDEHEDFKEEMDRLRALRGKTKYVRKPNKTENS
ncbi:hypothetical protein FQR65_LT14935 [Abscondita terminalis]|nr:hypothetical protein FQR65_LT14935 [Abscondita terminalis]